MGNSQRVVVFIVIVVFAVSVFGSAIFILAGNDSAEEQRETAAELQEQADELAEAQQQLQEQNEAEQTCFAAPINELAEPGIELPDYEITSGAIDELETIDLVVGDGQEVQAGDCVVAQYRGTLTDGTQFDGTYETGVPVRFPLGGVITGWQEGIPGMKVGGVRVLNIPSDQGYGVAGNPPVIGPNADLVFVVELVDIVEI